MWNNSSTAISALSVKALSIKFGFVQIKSPVIQRSKSNMIAEF